MNKENFGTNSSNGSQQSSRSEKNRAESIKPEYECIRPIESGPAPNQDIHREPYLLGEAAKSGTEVVRFIVFRNLHDVNKSTFIDVRRPIRHLRSHGNMLQKNEQIVVLFRLPLCRV